MQLAAIIHNFTSTSILKVFFQRIRAHQDGYSLLRAYIVEWQKFFDQCSYLPKPFTQFEKALSGDTVKKNTNGHSVVREVSPV